MKKYIEEEKILLSSNKIEEKELYSILRGGYEVWHNGKIVLETTKPKEAIEKYNSIVEKDNLLKIKF